MQMHMVDIHDTTVEEIHELICDTAVEIANAKAIMDYRLPKKARGAAFMNGSPYNGGGFILEIVQEYHTVNDRSKRIYREIAVQAIRSAILQHQDLFAGLILGEAKMGRNYFDHWVQAPTTLF